MDRLNTRYSDPFCTRKRLLQWGSEYWTSLVFIFFQISASEVDLEIFTFFKLILGDFNITLEARDSINNYDLNTRLFKSVIRMVI